MTLSSCQHKHLMSIFLFKYVLIALCIMKRLYTQLRSVGCNSKNDE